MTTTPGRNDPCPCGSGRKYKLCCLRVIEETDQRWRDLREIDASVVDAVGAFALDRWGAPLFEEAWTTYFAGTDVPDIPESHPEFGTLFIPWFVFDFRPGRSRKRRRSGWPTRPLAIEYLDVHRDALSEDLRQFIETACSSPLSFMVVTSTVPGRELTLRDVLTGQTHRVLDRSASTTARPTSLVLTRVVSVADVAIMVGTAPLEIPPSWHNVIIDVRERLAHGRGVLDVQTVRQLDCEILALYHRIADRLLNPALPQLRNTDGDPIALTTVAFELDCAPREAFDRLKSLALDAGDDDLLADATLGKSGELKAVSFPWLQRGNKMHRDWDNTSVGEIAIKGRRLTVSVNSERRAKKVRKLIEKRLGDDVMFVRQQVESVEAHLVSGRDRRSPKDRAEDDAFQSRPEVREALREMMARHWHSWLDTQVPALGNVTPREAARTPLGRERLEALFAEFEWRSELQPEQQRPDVKALRAKLKL